MALLLICPSKDPGPWLEAIAAVDPEIDVRVWPAIGDPADVTFALLWNHPPEVLHQFPNLKAVSSLGAGIDHINNDPSRPSQLPVARIVDPDLVQSMSEYVTTAALLHFRDFRPYQSQQTRKQWLPLPARNISDCTIGIMGMGELGSNAAKKLHALGFPVIGWSRRRKSHPALTHAYAGPDELKDFLQRSRILVCLLPLTPATHRILNYDCFSQLPQDAYVINVARGAHLVEQDLLRALSEGSLSGACLDVFDVEPLPAEHPFWQHPSITITPHIASLTNPMTAAPQVVENYRRSLHGESLLHQVDLKQGY